MFIDKERKKKEADLLRGIADEIESNVEGFSIFLVFRDTARRHISCFSEASSTGIYLFLQRTMYCDINILSSKILTHLLKVEDMIDSEGKSAANDDAQGL